MPEGKIDLTEFFKEEHVCPNCDGRAEYSDYNPH